MKTCWYRFISLVLALSLICKLIAAPILSVQAKNVFKKMEQLELLDALAIGDFHRADQILAKLDVNATGANGETVLWWQANIGNFEGFVYLLKSGANPIFQVSKSYNILELAASQEDSRFLQAVIAQGANVNMVSQFENVTPIFLAVQHRNRANVELLLKHGACPNVADTMGFTPLLWALDMKAFDIAVLLLKHGANPVFKNVQEHDVRASLREARVEVSDPMYDSFVEVKKLVAEYGNKGKR